VVHCYQPNILNQPQGQSPESQLLRTIYRLLSSSNTYIYIHIHTYIGYIYEIFYYCMHYLRLYLVLTALYIYRVTVTSLFAINVNQSVDIAFMQRQWRTCLYAHVEAICSDFQYTLLNLTGFYTAVVSANVVLTFIAFVF